MAGKTTSAADAWDIRIREIWLMGLAELHSNTNKVDFWRYYGELHDIKRRPLKVEWLEAAVAMGVIGRIRPARVTGYLKKLRERRAKLGQIDAFESFDSLIRNYLHPTRLTNHGFTGDHFDNTNRDHRQRASQVLGEVSHLTGFSAGSKL